MRPYWPVHVLSHRRIDPSAHFLMLLYTDTSSAHGTSVLSQSQFFLHHSFADFYYSTVLTTLLTLSQLLTQLPYNQHQYWLLSFLTCWPDHLPDMWPLTRPRRVLQTKLTSPLYSMTISGSNSHSPSQSTTHSANAHCTQYFCFSHNSTTHFCLQSLLTAKHYLTRTVSPTTSDSRFQIIWWAQITSPVFQCLGIPLALHMHSTYSLAHLQCSLWAWYPFSHTYYLAVVFTSLVSSQTHTQPLPLITFCSCFVSVRSRTPNHMQTASFSKHTTVYNSNALISYDLLFA